MTAEEFATIIGQPIDQIYECIYDGFPYHWTTEQRNTQQPPIQVGWSWIKNSEQGSQGIDGWVEWLPLDG